MVQKSLRSLWIIILLVSSSFLPAEAMSRSKASQWRPSMPDISQVTNKLPSMPKRLPSLPSKNDITAAIKRNPKKTAAALLVATSLLLWDHGVMRGIAEENIKIAKRKTLITPEKKLEENFHTSSEFKQKVINAIKDRTFNPSFVANIDDFYITDNNLQVHPCYKGNNSIISAIKDRRFEAVPKDHTDVKLSDKQIEILFDLFNERFRNNINLNHGKSFTVMTGCGDENLGYTLGVIKRNAYSNDPYYYGLNLICIFFKEYHSIYMSYRESHNQQSSKELVYSPTQEELTQYANKHYLKYLPLLPVRTCIKYPLCLAGKILRKSGKIVGFIAEKIMNIAAGRQNPITWQQLSRHYSHE